MVINGCVCEKTPFLESIGESVAQQVIDAHNRCIPLIAKYNEEDYILDELRKEYDKECGDILGKFRIPTTLHIPVDADLALVSIGYYDREDYWGCYTCNFLVDNKDANGFKEVGEAALWDYNEYGVGFHDEVSGLCAGDVLRIVIFMYALEHGATVYREFNKVYADDDRLYEEFTQ